VLLAVSRGIVEAEYDNDEFGLEGAKNSLQRASALTAQDVCLAILQAAQNFMDTAPADNDFHGADPASLPRRTARITA